MPSPTAPALRTRAAAALFAASWLLAAAPGADDAQPATAARPGAAEPDAAALRGSIERDRARLIELISRPEDRAGTPLADDPELREIAERLPGNQAALRESMEAPSPGDAPRRDHDE